MYQLQNIFCVWQNLNSQLPAKFYQSKSNWVFDLSKTKQCLIGKDIVLENVCSRS
jgi:hypothetical protein